MQVSTANNVKVYNLSAGKSLPEWISDRKKRTLLKNDVGESLNLLWPCNTKRSECQYDLWDATVDLCSLELRRRIELIQDFEMPISSSHIQVPINNKFATFHSQVWSLYYIIMITIITYIINITHNTI